MDKKRCTFLSGRTQSTEGYKWKISNYLEGNFLPQWNTYLFPGRSFECLGKWKIPAKSVFQGAGKTIRPLNRSRLPHAFEYAIYIIFCFPHAFSLFFHHFCLKFWGNRELNSVHTGGTSWTCSLGIMHSFTFVGIMQTVTALAPNYSHGKITFPIHETSVIWCARVPSLQPPVFHSGESLHTWGGAAPRMRSAFNFLADRPFYPRKLYLPCIFPRYKYPQLIM